MDVLVSSSVAAMTLTPGQLTALSNLAKKQAGEDVDWINISDARVLTELGLARRSREGWSITESGQAILKAAPEPEPPTAELHPFR